MREKCPYSELFWSAFFCIRTYIQNNSKYGHFLCTALLVPMNGAPNTETDKFNLVNIWVFVFEWLFYKLYTQKQQFAEKNYFKKQTLVQVQ